jgi:hypothetical protein
MFDNVPLRVEEGKLGATFTSTNTTMFSKTNQGSYGGTGSYLQVPNFTSAMVPFNGGITIGARVRLDDPDEHGLWGGIVSFCEDHGSYEKGWLLGYDSGKLSFRISTGTTGANWWPALKNPEDVVPGQWMTVFATYNGTHRVLYLDGIAVASWAEDSLPIAYVEDNRPNQKEVLTFGAFHDSNEQNPMTGAIQSVLIANTPFSAEEIVALGTLRSVPSAATTSIHICATVAGGTCTACTSGVASGCTAVTCASNKFDTNSDATDGCEDGCPVVMGGTCNTCSDKDTCSNVTCASNKFDINSDATDGCEDGCPVVVGGTCNTCSDKDTCSNVTCASNKFDTNSDATDGCEANSELRTEAHLPARTEDKDAAETGVGIGLGVSFGVLLPCCCFFFLVMRRRKKRQCERQVEPSSLNINAKQPEKVTV